MDYALSLAREHKIQDMDLMIGREESLTIQVMNAKVEKVDQSTGQGLGVRVVKEGRTGIASTERLERGAIERAVKDALENTALQDPTEVVLNTRFPEVPDPANLGLYNAELDNLSLEDLSAFGLEAEARVKEGDPRVKAVPYMVVGRDRGEYRIVSTQGMNYSQQSNSVGAVCQLLMEENGVRKSGTESWSARQWDPSQARIMADKAIKSAGGLLAAKKIPGGKMPVVLNEYCAPQMLGMFFGAFSGEAAQKGQSRLKGRLGEKIGKDNLTIKDDPHLVGGRASRYMDAEGVATQPLSLIENGVFSHFLYHVESARKEGVESTGHAGRGYGGGISTRTHNLIIEPGQKTTEELTAIPERCLLVTELEGAAGCNPLSGDISIGVQGYLVENGKRIQPVDSVTIAGNFFDLLFQIEEMGSTYQPNLKSVYIPAMLVEGLVVAS